MLACVLKFSVRRFHYKASDEQYRIAGGAVCVARRAGIRAQRSPSRLGAADRGSDSAGADRLVRRQRCRISSVCATRWSRRERCSGWMSSGGPAASSHARTRPTSRASRIARSSAASARKTRGRPTTGSRPRRCARRCAGFSRAACAGARCTSCRSRWDRSAARSRTSASRSPTARTSSSACGIMTRMGSRRVRRARHRRRIRAVRAFGRRAAARRARATCRGRATRPQIHRPFSRSARDLELRLGLRRQRAARQEMPCAADRVGDGPRRRLARRAHADPRRYVAGRREALRRRGVPERVRQDQLRDADSARRFRRLAA